MLKVIERVMLIFFKNDFINLWIAFESLASREKGTGCKLLNPTGNFLNSFASSWRKFEIQLNFLSSQMQQKPFQSNRKSGLIYSVCVTRSLI